MCMAEFSEEKSIRERKSAGKPSVLPLSGPNGQESLLSAPVHIFKPRVWLRSSHGAFLFVVGVSLTRTFFAMAWIFRLLKGINNWRSSEYDSFLLYRFFFWYQRSAIADYWFLPENEPPPLRAVSGSDTWKDVKRRGGQRRMRALWGIAPVLGGAWMLLRSVWVPAHRGMQPRTRRIRAPAHRGSCRVSLRSADRG